MQYKEYIKSALWSSGILYIFFIINFIGQIILARLLSPDDFGSIVLSLSIVEVIKVFFGFSVSMAYIKMEASNSLYGTAMFLALLGWIGMMIIALLLYYPISLFFGNDISLYVFLISFFSIFTYIAYIIEADLEKQVQFKKSSLLVGFSSFLGMCIALLFAYSGYEEKSLLMREIIAPIILLYLSLKSTDKKITFKYDILELKEMFLFVYKMLFSRGAEIIYTKVPFIMISTIYGSTTLGLISQMLYLVQLPAVALGPIATKVSYVFYSQHNNDQKTQKKGRKLISVFLFFLSIPFSVICYFYSHELLFYLWGEKWITGSEYLKQLFLFALLFPIYTNMKTYFYSIVKHEIVTKSFLIGFITIGLSMFFISKQYFGLIFSISIIFMVLYQLYYLKLFDKRISL